MNNIWTGNPQNLQADENGCYVLGYFDGVHKAHQELVRSTVEYSNGQNLIPGVFTFNGQLFTKSIPTRGMLTTQEEKCEFLSGLGIKNIFMVDFTDWLRDMSPAEFVDEILTKRLRARIVIVGPGFRFGKGGAGNPADLTNIAKENGIEVITIPSLMYDGKPISSTRIRKHLLFSGNISKANEMLGRKYSISGKVVKGAGIGKTIGFPTANLQIESEHKLIPADGVYACITHIKGEKIISAISIGNRPTFNDDHQSIEAYLLNYNDDCYNTSLELEFISRIRGQKKFDSPEQLAEQIKLDVMKVRNISGGQL